MFKLEKVDVARLIQQHMHPGALPNGGAAFNINDDQIAIWLTDSNDNQTLDAADSVTVRLVDNVTPTSGKYSNESYQMYAWDFETGKLKDLMK